MTLQELLVFTGGILLGWATMGWVAVCLFHGFRREMDQVADEMESDLRGGFTDDRP